MSVYALTFRQTDTRTPLYRTFINLSAWPTFVGLYHMQCKTGWIQIRTHARIQKVLSEEVQLYYHVFSSFFRWWVETTKSGPSSARQVLAQHWGPPMGVPVPLFPWNKLACSHVPQKSKMCCCFYIPCSLNIVFVPLFPSQFGLCFPVWHFPPVPQNPWEGRPSLVVLWFFRGSYSLVMGKSGPPVPLWIRAGLDLVLNIMWPQSVFLEIAPDLKLPYLVI